MKNFSLHIEQLDSKQMLSLSTWGLEQIHANLAWNITRGSKDVVVAIVDSGMDTNHVALKDNVWTNPGEIPNNGIDDEGNGYVDDIHGWNFANNNNNVGDGYGHGTHVAGIVKQVAPNVTIMPIKFLDNNGIGYTSGALNSLKYIELMKEKYNVNIVAVNASWQLGAGYSTVISTEINNLNKNNIMFVTAAGNRATNNDLSSSYSWENIVSVGALSMVGQDLASFSNYGKNTVHLAAPGNVIYSTFPDNNYGYLSGTSMATPFVTGTIALMKSVKIDSTVNEIKFNLLSSVNLVSTLTDKTVSGGYLDVNNAVRLSSGQSKMSYIVESPKPTEIHVKINRVYGAVHYTVPSKIMVVINGAIVKRFEAMGEFSETLSRRNFRLGWNTVNIYENGKLILKQRIVRAV